MWKGRSQTRQDFEINASPVPEHGTELFHDAESGQEDVEFEGVFSQGGLDVSQLQRATEVDGCITDLTQRKRCGAGSATMVVFSKHLISHPIRALDLPAAAPPFQQLWGIRLLSGSTRHGVTDRRLRLALGRGRSFQTQHLLHAWPVAGVDAHGGRCQCPGFNTTMALFRGGRGLPGFLCQSHSVGGGKALRDDEGLANFLMKRRLVVFDQHQVFLSLFLHLLAEIPLAEPRIRYHDFPV